MINNLEMLRDGDYVPELSLSFEDGTPVSQDYEEYYRGYYKKFSESFGSQEAGAKVLNFWHELTYENDDVVTARTWRHLILDMGREGASCEEVVEFFYKLRPDKKIEIEERVEKWRKTRAGVKDADKIDASTLTETTELARVQLLIEEPQESDSMAEIIGFAPNGDTQTIAPGISTMLLRDISTELRNEAVKAHDAKLASRLTRVLRFMGVLEYPDPDTAINDIIEIVKTRRQMAAEKAATEDKPKAPVVLTTERIKLRSEPVNSEPLAWTTEIQRPVESVGLIPITNKDLGVHSYIKSPTGPVKQVGGNLIWDVGARYYE